VGETKSCPEKKEKLRYVVDGESCKNFQDAAYRAVNLSLLQGGESVTITEYHSDGHGYITVTASPDTD